MIERTYTVELIESPVVDKASLIRFDCVVHKPRKTGTHPLLVFSHGSCGYDVSPENLKARHTYQPIADYFLKHNWIVAIPHRRGRGNSDGIYDEGLNKTRDGYSLDTDVALQGAWCAYDDLKACINSLLERPEVDESQLALGGHSRGGILSIMYAGQHPGKIKAVINFVGGWIGESKNAAAVNGELARQGGSYPNHTLWLYGGKDKFYSHTHTQFMFDEFTSAGGRGDYVCFTHADHDLLWSESIWQKTVDQYMNKLGFQGFEA